MSISKTLILSFAKDRWDGTMRSRQQVTSRLATKNTVIYITWNFTRKMLLQLPSLIFTSSNDFYSPIPNLYVFFPHQIITAMLLLDISSLRDIAEICLYKRSSFREKAKTIVRMLILQLIGRKVRELNKEGKPIVLYLWHPDFEFTIGKLNEDLVCYHIYDEHTLLSNNPQEIDSVTKNESKILDVADAVFAVSRELITAKKPGNSKIYFTPNGVDFEYFDDVDSSSGSIPFDIDKIPRPRVGYVGRVKSVLDYELILQIANIRSDWSIVLVGALGIKGSAPQYYKKLTECENIFLLGEKNVSDVPRYIKELDVCLLPYRLDTHMIKAYPLKLNEYLAMGKCIVSAALPCVKELELIKILCIARTLDEWISAIEHCLSNNTALIKERKSIALQNDWKTTVQRIEEIIFKELEKRLG